MHQCKVQEKLDKIMITIADLKSCEDCGNVFLKKVGGKITNRCPACNVWKKESITQ